MIIETAKYTNSGGHQINEDSILCGTDLFIVADGLGGHHGGENASAAAVNYISERYRGDISDNEIEQLLEGANTAVNQLNDDSHTTLAAAFVSGERVRIANIGDSRVYIFRNNKVHTVTRDHSVCQAAVDMGEMSYEDIRFSDDRSRLLKVLGNGSTLDLKTKYEPLELYDGDAFLLCSDGFWEYVHEREMEADLLKADSAESWKRLMLKRHLLKAKNEGDNYSLVCGIVHSERTLTATSIPATIAMSSTEQSPAKRSKGFLIILLLLLLAALAVFCFTTGNKLFSDTSENSTIESADTTLSETAESVAGEELNVESAELPEVSKETTSAAGNDELPASTNEAAHESSELPEATSAEALPDEPVVKPTPMQTEEPTSDSTESLPPMSDDAPDTAETAMLIPVQTGMSSFPDVLPEPDNSTTP